MGMVSTTLGEVPDTDLRHQLVEQDNPDVLTVACEWFYAGNDVRFAHHVGTLVRRDVWANLKTGLRSQAAQGA